IAQVPGVGQVFVGGGQQPAVRIQLDAEALAGLNLTLEDVRAVVASATTNQAKGALSGESVAHTVAANDQLLRAADYPRLIIAWRNGAPVGLRDGGGAIDDVENNRVAAWVDGRRAVLIVIRRQPGANIIEVIDRIKSLLPELGAAISPAIHLEVTSDRGKTIR